MCALFSGLLTAGSAQADWPTYRHDAARSGYTPEVLPSKLQSLWTYRALQSPQRAWPRSERLTYDRAFQPIVAGGLLFFGSSADHHLHALDAASGVPRWSFPTDGPIRFAPTFLNGRLYVVSDDGRLYCLDADTGKLIWKKSGSPVDALILGNDRMICRWPARGGPVVFGSTVYFAAGIWPSDGIYLHALDAVTGQPVWLNDSAGQIYMGQPHGGAYALSGVSAQGYLAATENQLFLPTGRSVPAAFNRPDGAFQYFRLQENGQRGGSMVMLSDQFLLNDGVAFDQKTGEGTGRLEGGVVANRPGGLVRAAAGELVVYQWAELERVDRKGVKETYRGLAPTLKATQPSADEVLELIVAGQHAVIGSSGSVSLWTLADVSQTWKGTVEGRAYGLAVSDGRLYVSTDQGQIACFGMSGPGSVRSPQPTRDPLDHLVVQAAEEIIKLTGVNKGYCLDLDCGDASLAWALAERTDLYVVAVARDPATAAAARARLLAAGIYGTRVTVLERDPTDTKLPIYFANLIVSDRSLTEGDAHFPVAEAARLQRPYGGVVCVGAVGSMRVQTRGPLEGAGNWTHQYANSANTACSDDEIIEGPLGMLWFTDVAQQLVQRHGRGPAPLVHEGVIYSEGIDSLVAIDAYNGVQLWEYSLPGILAAYDGDHLMGTSGTGSNFCISKESVYVRRDNYCLRLDARTGRLLGEFKAPLGPNGEVLPWGFIAWQDGILFGSLANQEHVVTYRYQAGGNMNEQLTESKTLFALDARNGAVKWTRHAKDSIRHNAIAIHRDYVVLIDRPLALYDRDRQGKPQDDPTGELVALYAETGEVLWRNTNNIYGTLTAISPAHDKVLMAYQPTRFRLASEKGGRMAVFNLSDGAQVWDQPVPYSSRPVINDRTIYAEGSARDLLTGQERPFNFGRSYGCGILASARNLMVYRSATLGYFDLKQNVASEDFGGVRPGCWVNLIPAGGLVFAPDASAGCRCSYQNQAWFALQPDGVRPPVVDPAGAYSKEPVTLRLRADRPETQRVHYTLDGTRPTAESPRYQKPLRLEHSAELQARAFDSNERASRVVSAAVVIDSHLLSAVESAWKSWDAPGAKPASAWRIDQGGVVQTANTFQNLTQAADPAFEHPGTFYIYKGIDPDGRFDCELHSGDNDTLGVAFRFQDAEHYYLFSMDRERGYAALTAKDGENYRLLASGQTTYQQNQWHQLELRLEGSRFSVYLDGQKQLEAEDHKYPQGTLALYCWGNDNTTFRRLRFIPAP